MAKLSLRIVKNLMKEGLKFGDVVGLVVKNTTYVAPLVLACLLGGFPVSTLDPTFDDNEVANIFRQTNPKMVFCDHDNFEIVVDAMEVTNNDSDIYIVDEKTTGTPHGFGIDGTKLCSVILCSSGTTGLSKGTMLSSAQCIQMTNPFPQVLNPTFLCFSSLYWLSGFTSLMYSLANCCKRVISRRKFSPLFMVHLIEKYKVNVIIAPPSQAILLIQSPVMKLADLSSIRIFMIGGGALAQQFRKSLQEHLLYGTLIFAYGMTEIGGLASMTLPFQKPSNSVGKITPNVKIKIVDEDGNILDTNDIGEIYVLSPTMFIGYANNPEATKSSFDAYGWYKTGDLGYITVDGEIFVIDRKKEMIKYLNYQVAPSELETFIQKIEGVKTVCVVGIPDYISGDLASAIVVKEENSYLTEQDIVDEVTRFFPQFKRLHGGVYFVDSLPITPSGKIKKVEVRKMATQLYKVHEINGNY
ncbi:CLUMA_CG005037, isoform A [Clunio marinus]|uniref:CLUMA_CG005037, isoform A n=1 Tax=Clunio marinus TaxID=568069 RepID=A0A1J1HVI0_9DIPT|nr:CLUMA_CG005037, isoform A [Clunio marinus]